MATYTKYDKTVEDVHLKKHNFGTDTLKILLSNTAPTVATDNVQADTTEIAVGNGYTLGGETVAITSATQTGGVFSLVPTADVVFTASGGSIGSFRYAILWNSTANLLVSYWDRGSPLTLLDGESFTVDVQATLFTAS